MPQSEPLWLIRTEENWITRPLLKQDVIDRLNRLEIKLNDEVCPGDGYWFFIHEKEEVFKHLGVYPPSALWRGQRSEDEITDTETQTLGADEDTVAETGDSDESSTRMMDVPPLEMTPEDPVRAKAKSFRSLNKLPLPPAHPPQSVSGLPPAEPPSARRQRQSRSLSPLARQSTESVSRNRVMEGPKVWSVMAGLMVGLLVGLLYLMVRRLAG